MHSEYIDKRLCNSDVTMEITEKKWSYLNTNKKFEKNNKWKEFLFYKMSTTSKKSSPAKCFWPTFSLLNNTWRQIFLFRRDHILTKKKK